MKRFIPRYLDPASRLGEILFGLIMVLTVTLAAGLTVTDDRAGVRELLLAAIGCNVAWGIIDAVMYVMNCITVRSAKIRLVQAVQRVPDSNAALELIQTQIEPELQELIEPEEARAFSESVLKHLRQARITKTLLTREDLYGALACFWLVFISFADGDSVFHFLAPTFSTACVERSPHRAALLRWSKMGAPYRHQSAGRRLGNGRDWSRPGRHCHPARRLR